MGTCNRTASFQRSIGLLWLNFLSKSIVIRLTSKWSQSSGRGAAQLNVVKPKFAEFFSVAKILLGATTVYRFFATFRLTQGDFA